MRHLKPFESFNLLNEGGKAMGGKAINGTRPIKQWEVKKTLQDFRNKIYPILQIKEADTLLIGSAGRKLNPEDLSGDIDIGIAINRIQENFGDENTDQLIHDKIVENFPFMSINWMKGIRIISTAWPIMGESANGHVQLDIIPIDDMKWAKFIYRQPNHRLEETKYKSAHRNWLFASILSTMKENQTYNDDGDLIGYDGYMMVLTRGLVKIKKSYEGKTKLLSRAYNVREEEKLFTKDPQEFINFLFGDDSGYDQTDVTLFENTWEITKKVYPDKLPEIKEELIRFLKRVDIQIPLEIETSDAVSSINQ